MLLKKTEVFECDDLIANSIIELNMKGFSTEFSCSGHISNKTTKGNRMHFDTYVMFGRVASFLLKTIPTNWVEDTMGGHKIIRRSFTQEESIMFSDKELLELASKELKNWSRALKPIGYLYSSVDIKEVADDRIVQ